MKELKKIVRLISNYKRFLGLNVLFNILSTIFAVFSFASLMPVLDILFTNKELVEKTNTVQEDASANILSLDSLKETLNNFLVDVINDHGPSKALLYVCIILIVSTLFKNVFRFLASYFLILVRMLAVKSLRNQAFSKIVHLPLGYFSDEKKGALMSRLTNDINEVEWNIKDSVESLLRDSITVVIYFIFLLQTSTELTLFVLIALPLSGIFIGKIGKSLKKSSTKTQEKVASLLSIIEETIGGLRIIKAFAAEKKVVKTFEAETSEHAQLAINMQTKQQLASPFSEIMGVCVVSMILLYGGKLVFQGDMDPGSFIFYIALFSQLITPGKGLANSMHHVNRCTASLDRIQEVLDEEPKIKEIDSPKTINELKEVLKLDQVSFSYLKNGEPVLKNISLEVQKGKTIALVGQSGSGKSTLVDLIPRFYDVDSGTISLDGVDIKEFKLADLRKLFGIVSQQSILFNDTIYNNIAFGVDDVTEEQVIEAAKIANAHTFVSQFDNGYQTNIGDGGNKLSGGQKQRISIARAVLKNPSILILDEATSALDTESEKMVQEALYQLMENHTSIVIAHRLSTIQHADEIIVMGQGEILERGTHQSLLELNGVYTKLIEMQKFS